MAKKSAFKGDLQIPKPTKKAMSPNIDFSNEIQTDYTTLNSAEKVIYNRVKNLKGDIETEKIKK